MMTRTGVAEEHINRGELEKKRYDIKELAVRVLDFDQDMINFVEN